MNNDGPDFEKPVVPEDTGDTPVSLVNVASGFRLALFLRVRRADFHADVNQAALALLIATGFTALLQLIDALPVPELNIFGASYLAAVQLASLAGLWLVAAALRATDRLPLLVVMTATASITMGFFIFAVQLSLGYILEANAYHFASLALAIVGGLWQIAILIRAVGLTFDLKYRHSAAVAILFLAVAVTPVIALPMQMVWYEGARVDESAGGVPDYRPVNIERTYYAQRSLLDTALAAIEPGRRGTTDLYFVGFAGNGHQDVFMKEIRAARSLFDEQFDTDGRSLTLINNTETIDDTPLANVSNLRIGISGLAERMDRDEDILFLFLTSHGSPGRFSTGFRSFQHNSLTPEDLRAILDDSGLRWRVIVVSACYSGSFIEALENDDTLVITASREDRNSFGCSDDAEFTYFGRAMFDEALRETRSFTEAFAIASLRIAERETEMDYTPSEPQIFMGSRIQGKLADLEDRLRTIGDVAAEN